MRILTIWRQILGGAHCQTHLVIIDLPLLQGFLCNINKVIINNKTKYNTRRLLPPVKTHVRPEWCWIQVCNHFCMIVTYASKFWKAWRNWRSWRKHARGSIDWDNHLHIQPPPIPEATPGTVSRSMTGLNRSLSVTNLTYSFPQDSFRF